MNFDVGHYVAGTNESPIPIIEKYAAEGRILSLHLKDRKVNNGPNMPFGLGDTPLDLIISTQPASSSHLQPRHYQDRHLSRDRGIFRSFQLPCLSSLFAHTSLLI